MSAVFSLVCLALSRAVNMFCDLWERERGTRSDLKLQFCLSVHSFRSEDVHDDGDDVERVVLQLPVSRTTLIFSCHVKLNCLKAKLD